MADRNLIMETLQKTIQSNPATNNRFSQVQQIARRWQKLGLLQGFKKNEKYLKYNTAVLLQNQARQLMKQAMHTSNTKYSEQWAGIAMPLVRRFMHKLASKEFVSVQAMSAPVGLVFFLDQQFGTSRRGFQAGESIYGTVFQGNPGSADYVMNTNIEKGLYGAGKWGYTLNDVEIVYSGSASIKAENNTSGSASILNASYFQNDSRFAKAYQTEIGNGKMKIITVPCPSDADKNGYDTFIISNTESNVSDPNYIVRLFREYTRLSYEDGKQVLKFLVLTGNTGSFDVSVSKSITLSYHRQPTIWDRGDFEYRGDSLATDDIGIPEFQIKITQKPITSQTRKYKAIWTQELVQDFGALLSIDAEQEISNMLTDQIVLETDLELIAMLTKGAMESRNEGYFSVRPGYEVSSVVGGVVSFTTESKYAIPDKSSWFRNIGIPMQKVSQLINQKTAHGGANFAIVSPAIATVLESTAEFVVDSQSMQWANGGVVPVGTFKNRYRIFVNPLATTDNTIIMGYRGQNPLDFGAAYCPYVPLILLPQLMEPVNFALTRGVFTRYAKTMLRSDFYGVVYVEGLETV